MKIVQIANGDFFSTYGGGQVYVKNIVDEMIRQQIAVSVFSFVNKNALNSYEKKNYNGIDLYEIYTQEESLIEKLLKEIKPDIIHAHAEKAFIAKISKKLHIPCVVTAHHGGITCPAGMLMNSKDEICRVPVSQKNCLPCVLRNIKGGQTIYPLLKHIPLNLRLNLGSFLDKLPFIYFVTPYGKSSLFIEEKKTEWKTIIKNVDVMIAPSHAIAENMVLNGLDKEKVKVIPHGIPITSNNNIEVENNSFKVKFFYIGRIGYVKGIHLLLETFIQLPEDCCELHLVGDISGKYEKQLIDKYKNNKNIVFHGKIEPERVLDYIQQFDVLVHPAICLEVFGLNIAEALSQGKPVIATRCGGAEMQIKDKENGILVEPNNSKELKKAIQEMITILNQKKMPFKTKEVVIPLENHVKELLNQYNQIRIKNEI